MSDLTNATRELFLRSLKNQVFMKTPFYEELSKRRQISVRGGTSIKRLTDVDEMDDLAQEYTSNEALTDSKKDMLAKPSFTIKKWQIPLRYDVDDELQNIHGGKEEQLLNLADYLVKKGQRGAKLKMTKLMFNTGSDTPVADGSKSFQSLVSALDHDTTYGTISRSFSAGTNDYWQGADAAGLSSVITSSSQDTATNMTISNLRKWITESDVSHYMENVNDLYIMMCPTLYNKLRAEMEAKMVYKPTGDTQSQGFNKMELDGHQIVSVPYLQTTTNMKTWVFICNLSDWELRIHSERNFKMTEFKWQGDQSNGFDYWLARILVAGNLICWKPNGSLWLSNVS